MGITIVNTRHVTQSTTCTSGPTSAAHSFATKSILFIFTLSCYVSFLTLTLSLTFCMAGGWPTLERMPSQSSSRGMWVMVP